MEWGRPLVHGLGPGMEGDRPCRPSCAGARGLVPPAPVLARVLHNLKMAVGGRGRTRLAVPPEAALVRPRQDVQVPAPGVVAQVEIESKT